MDLPIACSLTAEQLRERRAAVLEIVRKAAIDIQELADGYAYVFNAGPEILLEVANLVNLERQCCPFLTFSMTEEPQSMLRLEVTGPLSAKSMIADFFGPTSAST